MTRKETMELDSLLIAKNNTSTIIQQVSKLMPCSVNFTKTDKRNLNKIEWKTASLNKVKF